MPHHEPGAGAGDPTLLLRLDRGLDRLRNVPRLRPGLPVVVAVDNVLVRIRIGVISPHAAPDPAVLRVDDRAGVVYGIRAVIPDHDLRAPGLAAILAAPDHRVDVADVGTAHTARLGKGQDRAFLRDRQGRNAVSARLAVLGLGAYAGAHENLLDRRGGLELSLQFVGQLIGGQLDALDLAGVAHRIEPEMEVHVRIDRLLVQLFVVIVDGELVTGALDGHRVQVAVEWAAGDFGVEVLHREGHPRVGEQDGAAGLPEVHAGAIADGDIRVSPLPPADRARKDDLQLAVAQRRLGRGEPRPVRESLIRRRNHIEAVNGIPAATDVVLRDLRGLWRERLFVQHAVLDDPQLLGGQAQRG